MLGYDVKGLGIYDDLELLGHQKIIPDVVLIKKFYPKKLIKRRKFWKLKRLPIAEQNWGKKHKNNEELDMEELREDLEQDKVMRKKVNLYLVSTLQLTNN